MVLGVGTQKKRQERERGVVPYEFYINLRILRGTEYDFVM